MSTDRLKMTEKILHHFVEIIYLLTGEEYVIMKKNSSADLVHLLDGEVHVKCGDVAVYFSMEEWEYIEGHKELYKDAMMETPQTLSTSKALESAPIFEQVTYGPEEDHLQLTAQRLPEPCAGESSHDYRAMEGITATSPKGHQEDCGGIIPTKLMFDGRKSTWTPVSSEDQTRDDRTSVEAKRLQEKMTSRDERAVSVDEKRPQDKMSARDETAVSVNGKRPQEKMSARDETAVSVDEKRPQEKMSASDERALSTEEKRSRKCTINKKAKYTYPDTDGEKPFWCRECGKEFNYKSQLIAHKRVHTKAHMAVPTKEKPHHCNECGKNFEYPMNLELHMRTHTGKKPHACDQCGEHFASTYKLSVHQRKHAPSTQF
ncbi:uncharacterized protein O3C94_022604 isoform 2-T2 [Discoglossus pictus]